MKTFSFLKAAFLIAAIPFLFSCEKEPLSELQVSSESAYGRTDNGVERPFKGRLVSGTRLEGDEGSGWTEGNPVPAWYPGTGEGNVTHLGKFTVYFNQYVSTINPDFTATVTDAPVNMFFADLLYDEYGITVPDEVSYVLVDKQGNSIWAEAIDDEYYFTFLSETQAYINNEVKIIGGTGRFAGASGTFTVEGYSNLDFENETTTEVLTYDGVIIY